MYLKSAGVQRTIHAEDEVQPEEILDKPKPVEKGGPAVILAEPETAKDKPVEVQQEAPEVAKPMRSSRRSKMELSPSETDTADANNKDGKVITATGDSDNKAKPSLTVKKNMDEELEETEEEMRAVLENLKSKKIKNPFSQDNESVSFFVGLFW